MFTRSSVAALVVAVCGVCCFASDTSLPRIIINDNTLAAGMLNEGVLKVDLEIREGSWYPEAEDGPHIGVYGFGETGKALSIPGPLIRVPEGTQIHATVRNTLDTALAVHGLNQRPGKDEPVTLMPGEQHVFDFPAGAPGTYYYWAGPPGTTMGGVKQRWDGKSSQLSGALVVDKRGEKAVDRVFVIGLWRVWDDLEHFVGMKEFAVINGKSWPYTERLKFRMGDEARWRWINASGAIHPMHMHGSYYRIDSTGTGEQDRPYAPEMRPTLVTYLMPPGSTMDTAWTPASPGHWLFHCHLMAHLEEKHSLSAIRQLPAAHPHAHTGMVGLVMALDVEGAPKIKRAAYRNARKLALIIDEKRAQPLEVNLRLVDGRQSFESQNLEGPPIVLHRGQPTEITVVNHLAEPTSIHWHGIELESYYDGVPYFTGMGKRLTPMIPPGGKFVARMTPPRTGTFIYHTHWHDIAQLEGGLHGALLVVDEGQYRPEVDQVFVAARSSNEERPLIVNGTATPAGLQWKAGTRYHLRFINIAPSIPLTFSLSKGSEKLAWRAVSKDGMALPPAQQMAGAAAQLVAVGETYEFETTIAHPGDVTLRAHIDAIPGITKQYTVEIPIRVR